MKKLISLLAVSALLLSLPAAYADVLNEGWKDASDEELQAAAAEINAELGSRKAAQRSEEAQTISGKGTAIEEITVATVPARVTFTCKDEKTSEAVIITDGSRTVKLNPYRSCKAEGLISEAGTYSVRIETPDEWALSIQPLAETGAFTSVSGNSSVLSDIFTLDAPTVVTVSVDPTNETGSFIIEFWYNGEDGWKYDYEQTLMPVFNGEPYSYDTVLNPQDGATQYAILVYSNYADLNWSITAK